MRIITTTGTRIIKVILRYIQLTDASYSVLITNENTKEVVEIDVNDWTLSDYNNNIGQLLITITENYEEGGELSLKVVKDDVVYYRNKIFVTDQTPQNYNING